MSRNVTIVIIILTLVVIAGYLVWLRGKYIEEVAPILNREETETVSEPTPSLSPSPIVTPTPSATASAKSKTATPSATPKR